MISALFPPIYIYVEFWPIYNIPVESKLFNNNVPVIVSPLLLTYSDAKLGTVVFFNKLISLVFYAKFTSIVLILTVF